MKRTYQRSPILSFFELNSEQLLQALNELGSDTARDTSYVLYDNEAFPLCSFERTNKGLFHLTHSLSAFSAYMVKINKTGDAATVVYAHW